MGTHYFLVFVLALASAKSMADISFDEFLSRFHKTYENEEEAIKRMGIFQNNVQKIEDHNKLYESGKSSFEMGVNKYSDMTYDEVVSVLTGDIETNSIDLSYDWYVPTEVGDEPNSLDYRYMGALNPVKDQGHCGSCWAFGAVGAIESHIFLKNGELVQLSEQYLVDCSRGYGFPADSDSGCDGGWSYRAIEFVENNGIALEDAYPYTAEGGTCNEDAPKTDQKVIGMQRVMKYTDADLLNAIVHTGPIKVSINVTDNFHHYKGGVLVDDLCPTGNTGHTNHAVMAVGFGNEDGQDYWVIRNSWGESWGEEGYMKLSRDISNHCQVSAKAYFPIIEEKI